MDQGGKCVKCVSGFHLGIDRKCYDDCSKLDDTKVKHKVGLTWTGYYEL